MSAVPRLHTRTPHAPSQDTWHTRTGEIGNICSCLMLLFANHACWFLGLHEKMGRNLAPQCSTKRTVSEYHHWQWFCILRQNLQRVKLPAPHTHTYREAWLSCGHLLPCFPYHQEGYHTCSEAQDCLNDRRISPSALTGAARVTPDTSHGVREQGRGSCLLSWLFTAPSVSPVHL